jgi:hypothetical protein
MTLNDRSSSGVLVCAESEPSAIKEKMCGYEVSGNSVWKSREKWARRQYSMGKAD